MSAHREKAVEAIYESMHGLYRPWRRLEAKKKAGWDKALKAAEPDLQRMYFERFEAQVNEEAADFASQLEDLASIVNSPTGNHEAVVEDLNRIACELAALQPSSLATRLAKERERFKEAVLSAGAANAAADRYEQSKVEGATEETAWQDALEEALSKAQELMEEGR